MPHPTYTVRQRQLVRFETESGSRATQRGVGLLLPTWAISILTPSQRSQILIPVYRSRERSPSEICYESTTVPETSVGLVARRKFSSEVTKPRQVDRRGFGPPCMGARPSLRSTFPSFSR
jgi:hypothetical protein